MVPIPVITTRLFIVMHHSLFGQEAQGEVCQQKWIFWVLTKEIDLFLYTISAERKETMHA